MNQLIENTIQNFLKYYSVTTENDLTKLDLENPEILTKSSEKYAEYVKFYQTLSEEQVREVYSIYKMGIGVFDNYQDAHQHYLPTCYKRITKMLCEKPFLDICLRKGIQKSEQ